MAIRSVARAHQAVGEFPRLGSSDILANVRLPSGTIAEIQDTIPEVISSKAGRGHKIYEEWEALKAKQENGPLSTEDAAQMKSLEEEANAGYRGALDAARLRAASARKASGVSESSSGLRGNPPEKSDLPSESKTQTSRPPGASLDEDTLKTPSVDSKNEQNSEGKGSGSGMVRRSGTSDTTPEGGAESVRKPSASDHDQNIEKEAAADPSDLRHGPSVRRILTDRAGMSVEEADHIAPKIAHAERRFGEIVGITWRIDRSRPMVR